MFMLKQGNTYNVPVCEFYVESDEEMETIPATAPVGSIAIVNKSGNFHKCMKMEDGTWNLFFVGYTK